MSSRFLLWVPLTILLSSCAQVPRESVELSATVGRDMAEMQKAHIALVNQHYDRLLGDVDRFIDNVYMPYQVQTTLADEFWKKQLLSAIESASQPDPTGVKQKEGLEKIAIFVEVIHGEVEAYRKQKTEPLKTQRAALLDSIDNTYKRIQYANSVVTGHLASVVKVHEAQDEILAKLEMEDFRKKVSVNTAAFSDRLSVLTEAAELKDAQIRRILDDFEALVGRPIGEAASPTDGGGR